MELLLHHSPEIGSSELYLIEDLKIELVEFDDDTLFPEVCLLIHLQYQIMMMMKLIEDLKISTNFRDKLMMIILY